jgi:hypothetical protein
MDQERTFAPGDRHPCGSGLRSFAEALLMLLTVGLIWQFVLVLILLRRELGSLEWRRVRDALWLRPPRDPILVLASGHQRARLVG